MSRAILVAILLVACGGNPSAPAPPDAPVDAAGTVRPDGGPTPDAPQFEGVACDVPANACVAPDGVCCTGAGNDRCLAPQGLCGGERMQCDGPEDCGSGNVCCYIQGHGALCTPAGMCAAGDDVMCHRLGPPSCPGALHCCDLRGGPLGNPYGVCLSGGCPATP